MTVTAFKRRIISWLKAGSLDAVLKNDSSGVLLYDKGKLETMTVGELAREALASRSRISRTPITAMTLVETPM